MKVYEALSLGEFIALLETLGNAPVRGFDGKIHSYRGGGYYERNATTPSDYVLAADTLANAYRAEIGKPIEGWMHDDYPIKADELIYYAAPLDTGAAIAGLERSRDGVYDPIGVSGDLT
jgi:hypothetical protein